MKRKKKFDKNAATVNKWRSAQSGIETSALEQGKTRFVLVVWGYSAVLIKHLFGASFSMRSDFLQLVSPKPAAGSKGINMTCE
jgi:hypothetical protein